MPSYSSSCPVATLTERAYSQARVPPDVARRLAGGASPPPWAAFLGAAARTQIWCVELACCFYRPPGANTASLSGQPV